MIECRFYCSNTRYYAGTPHNAQSRLLMVWFWVFCFLFFCCFGYFSFLSVRNRSIKNVRLTFVRGCAAAAASCACISSHCVLYYTMMTMENMRILLKIKKCEHITLAHRSMIFRCWYFLLSSSGLTELIFFFSRNDHLETISHFSFLLRQGILVHKTVLFANEAEWMRFD